MRKYELSCNWGLSYLSTFCSRQERERFVKIIRQWKGDTDKTRIIREMLFEQLAHVHILTQRLYDNKITFDGDETDYSQVRKITDEETGWESTEKVGVIGAEHQAQKQKEMEKYLPMLSKIQIDLAKLLLAKDVQLHLHEDRSVSDLFSALEKRGAVSTDNGKQERIT